MSSFFIVLMVLAMFLTLASLVLGLVVMTKGGDLNKKYGNKLMQARVVMQGAALAMFVLAMLTGK